MLYSGKFYLQIIYISKKTPESSHAEVRPHSGGVWSLEIFFKTLKIYLSNSFNSVEQFAALRRVITKKNKAD